MAYLSNKALFFITSPRTPAKMIPEIQLLCEKFEGELWNPKTQEMFIDELASSEFFEGKGSPSNKAFSARDRINRAPKSFGFVDLNPCIALTEAGKALIYGKRPQEIFLRQLLKFQLPSPYHVEIETNKNRFYIRPYLEIFRLIRQLGYLTFDEFKIFAVQLTDYRDFEIIKNKILVFRNEKENHKGEYKRFVDSEWDNEVIDLFKEEIAQGKTKTRETMDASVKKFVMTKRKNFRDYADACFRYLRYTGLVSISHRNKSISIFDDKLSDVDFILDNIERKPVFVNDIYAYKEYLFNPTIPKLYADDLENIVDIVMRIGSFTKRDLVGKSIEELKDLRDGIVAEKKKAVIDAQVAELKSYSLYSEIIDTYNEIISNEYYDAPLMFEYNTWRAMTMLDGGNIKGNFKFDDKGQPLSTAVGNMPDIECDYVDFSLSVEVTLQSGQRQYESESEPVARHYGQLKKKTGKETYCLFIAPTINTSTLAHFYALNHMEIAYYGGKSKIIPLELEQFMKLVENSYTYINKPIPSDVQRFFDDVIEQGELSKNEIEWQSRIQNCVNDWLVVNYSAV